MRKLQNILKSFSIVLVINSTTRMFLHLSEWRRSRKHPAADCWLLFFLCGVVISPTIHDTINLDRSDRYFVWITKCLTLLWESLWSKAAELFDFTTRMDWTVRLTHMWDVILSSNHQTPLTKTTLAIRWKWCCYSYQLLHPSNIMKSPQEPATAEREFPEAWCGKWISSSRSIIWGCEVFWQRTGSWFCALWRNTVPDRRDEPRREGGPEDEVKEFQHRPELKEGDVD